MSHIQPQEIQAALDTGKPVWSRAMGRWGRITRVDGTWIELRAGRLGKGQKCVTFFHCGDQVRMAELEDRFVITTDFAAIAQTIGQEAA